MINAPFFKFEFFTRSQLEEMKIITIQINRLFILMISIYTLNKSKDTQIKNV